MGYHTKKLMILMLIVSMLSVLLCGCSESVHYADVPDQYVRTLDYHDDFVIVQLTDIHWNSSTLIGNDEYGSVAYIKSVINAIEEKFGGIDLIEITGDTFCLTSPLAVNHFIDMMESIKIPYAMTWGNHDRQSTYNPNWLSKKIINAPYSLYTEVDNDDLNGRGNYVIELMENDKPVWQIFNIDSGASYRTGAADIGLEYDFVRQDQIDWFDEMHKNAGSDVPVMCYYHIPQIEFVDAFEAIEAGDPEYKSKFTKLEGISISPYATSLNPVFVRNNVKGVFIGHDHANDWTFTNPDGITYGYGVKTTAELYSSSVNDECDLTGASVVVLKNKTGDFDLYHLYLSDKVESPGAIWEKY